MPATGSVIVAAETVTAIPAAELAVSVVRGITRRSTAPTFVTRTGQRLAPEVAVGRQLLELVTRPLCRCAVVRCLDVVRLEPSGLISQTLYF